MGVDGSNQRALGSAPADDREPVVSPDGTRIAFTTERYGTRTEIAVMNRDGSDVVRLTFDTTFSGDPAWSPDGQWIVFKSEMPNEAKIEQVRVDGSDRTTMLENGWFVQHVVWAPNGQLLAHVAEGNIWTMAPDGTGASPLVERLEALAHPVWAPDGTRIAFSCIVNGNQDICIADAATGEVLDSLDTEYDEIEPAWSPDGESLVFTRNVDLTGSFTNRDVIRRRLSDGAEQRLTTLGADDMHPAWASEVP